MASITLPAMLAKGELVADRETNCKLLVIQNSELPRLAATYRQEPMGRTEMREMLRKQDKLIRVVKNQKVYKPVVNKEGVKLFVESQNATTHILNKQFSLPGAVEE